MHVSFQKKNMAITPVVSSYLGALTPEDARAILLPSQGDAAGDRRMVARTGVMGVAYLVVSGELVMHLIVEPDGRAVAVSRIPNVVLTEVRAMYPWVDEHFCKSFRLTCTLNHLVTQVRALRFSMKRHHDDLRTAREQAEAWRAKVADSYVNEHGRDLVVADNMKLREQLQNYEDRAVDHAAGTEARLGRENAAAATLLEMRQMLKTFMPSLTSLGRHTDPAVQVAMRMVVNVHQILSENTNLLLYLLDLNQEMSAEAATNQSS